jgi:hypothetical protein
MRPEAISFPLEMFTLRKTKQNTQVAPAGHFEYSHFDPGPVHTLLWQPQQLRLIKAFLLLYYYIFKANKEIQSRFSLFYFPAVYYFPSRISFLAFLSPFTML